MGEVFVESGLVDNRSEIAPVRMVGDGVVEVGRSTVTRVVVLGDMGGHVDVMRDALASIGADPVTGTIPRDVVVVQVGDLVRVADDPLDSVDCLRVADLFMARSPGQ